jgi:hypothetical protein
MAAGTKTDNHNPAAKLALRRHFLRNHHAAGRIDVMDCFQATGRLWSVLKPEFAITSYWGVDVTPKKGRLQIDSQRILDQPGWTQNVVDLDAYGSPWKHWFSLVKFCAHPVTVFLTIGMVKMGGGNYDHALAPILGLNFKKLELPNSLGAKLHQLSIDAALSVALQKFTVVECQEAKSGGNCRYIGVHLVPLQKT